MGRPLLHTVLLCQVLSSTAAIFVDTERPIIFQNSDRSFGHQIVQLGKWVIVSAPRYPDTTNKTGRLYRCDPRTTSCSPIPINGSPHDRHMSLGLSLSVQEKPPQVLACGPTLQRTCGQNMYVNGRCYFLDEQLRVLSVLPPSLPECSLRGLDIAFLIDGSSSIASHDFRTMLDFVAAVMRDFSSSDAQFALMQYSSKYETHFNFMNFSKIRDATLLTGGVTQQLGGSTRTCTAILQAIELFSPHNGARDNVEKLLIVITDGESRMDNTPSAVSTREANEVGVRRFAIGVGDVFSRPHAHNELKSIASPEPDDHIFKVTNFSALKGLPKILEDKIFTIEGMQTRSGDRFQMEVSQEGFSALLTQDGAILGAVGANNWAGGAYSYRTGQEKATWIQAAPDGSDMKDSYMGYAMQQVNQDLIAIGAPRFLNLGRVVIYRRNPNRVLWSQVATVTGKQIGSYFGSVLSSLHVNSSHALLLVGAPTHFSADSPNGLVYLCPIRKVMDSHDPNYTNVSLTCPWTLRGDSSQAVGHFGSAISILPDLTGDEFCDLAVGAPCEDNHHGAVYIFSGKNGGFKTSYIQRIPSWQVRRTLMYFGRSLTGNYDMTGDNLPDLAVGAEGEVLILRSRPVLGVSVSMMFDPVEISRAHYECADHSRQGPVTTVTICFTIHVRSKEVSGVNFGQLTYNVYLDAGRANTRALFSGAGRSVEKTLTVHNGDNCQRHSIDLPECVEDSVTPLRTALSYFLKGNPVLSEDSPTSQIREILFEKNCGGDGECQDDLRVNLIFSNLTQLVVGLFPDVNVTVSVKNLGDDSYNTRVLLPFPSGLSYRRVSVLESNKRVMVTCTNLEGRRVVECGVNRPLLRPNTTVVFLVSFHLAPTADLGDLLTLTANVSSDNGGAFSQRKTSWSGVRVLYSVYVTVSSLEETSKYQNFSSSDDSIRHVYKVINLGQRRLPLSIIFLVPLRLGNASVWKKPKISSSKTEISTCSKMEETSGEENFQKLIKMNPVLNCLVGTCVRITCDIRDLDCDTSVTFTISGTVTTDWSTQTEVKRISVQSSAEIVYDSQRFRHLLQQEQHFIRAQARTVLELRPVYSYTPLIIGSSVGGLGLLAVITAGLHKLGFFKRHYKEMLESSEESVVMSPEKAEPVSRGGGGAPALNYN
ncbi:integrin alpha-M-like isoform X2 [Dendropsophus ebraccatus]|uniref:integrin alpha-M-like isoform X2 n=1 Tax=Dendropsophus ebraccatus TaxID=150705 RepID=UPI0038322EB6